MSRKKWIRLFQISFLAIAVLILSVIPFVNNGMGQIKALSIKMPELTSIKDGSYAGSYSKGRWGYDLIVTVQNSKIISIDITNTKMAQFKDFNEKCRDAVISSQTIELDAISGASIHSKVFFKAVENALKKGMAK